MEEVEAPDELLEISNGSETVLLVEDEERVRSMAREVLESRGYKVTEASRGEEALEICGKWR